MDHAVARRNMVDSQIRPMGLSDQRLVQAMAETRREAFLSRSDQGLAYMGGEIELGEGRVLSAPLTLARLIDLAQVKPGDVVLHIGAGAGYGSALLAQLASTVVALDSSAPLVETANRVLADLGVLNVVALQGQMSGGYAKQAPYDVILIEGQVEEIPESLFEQLAEGGRLVAPLSQKGGKMGRGTVFLKSKGALGRREAFDCAASALPGFEAKAQFIFA